jgi:hypothetical protein
MGAFFESRSKWAAFLREKRAGGGLNFGILQWYLQIVYAMAKFQN